MKSIIQYNKQEVDKYLNDLRIIGALSSLFSANEVPLLHYRVTENLYSEAFGADDLSRFDIAIDAKLRTYGIGIKTFIEGNNGKSYQKIAEFNSQIELYNNLPTKEKIIKISELRNKRIQSAKAIYGINNSIYHCIIRNRNYIKLFEEFMQEIDINAITIVNNSDSKSIKFIDGKAEYSFYTSKSTLYKRFDTTNHFASIKVDILENPMNELRKLFSDEIQPQIPEILILPLYSYKRSGTQKYIPERSGLNQWNAGGRKRNLDEVYVPYPALIRNQYDGYFPDRKTSFDVQLPNGKIISMKICQEDGKAIMSNPNRELGEWILRDILKVPQRNLITYEMLQEIGIDAVCFEKIGNTYKMNFVEIGEYEKFVDKNLMSDYE